MIKLIASDMDGTFLGREVRMPRGAYDTIREVTDAGILFVAASGRALSSLEQIFAPVGNDIAYVAENGSVVHYKGEELSVNVVQNDVVANLVNFLENTEGHPVINCRYQAHVFPRIKPHYKTIEPYCANIKDITSLNEVVEEVISVSVFIENSKPLPLYKKLIENFGDDVFVVVSGQYWIDIMPKGSNKGDGLRVLMKKLGIKEDEVMAFGDYDNDIDMLELAKESYAMTHGTAGVKAVAKHQCEPSEILGIMRGVIDGR
ncbi:MAG: hypothetical protein ATN35_06550 [Epulopiscium sp. Nele67-Bin004]|nr:MAG: hypothetical protein ATN35_06550 [Epulopiscium sp. Nele67-Bin004]